MYVTRWSSTVFLLRRYIDLSIYFVKCDTEIAELLPNPSEEFKIQALIFGLTDIQSITWKFQEEFFTLADVQFFDALIHRFHSMCKYLCDLADLVDNPQFEAAVVKLFTTLYEDMKLSEKVHLGRFRTQCESISPTSQTNQVNIFLRGGPPDT